MKNGNPQRLVIKPHVETHGRASYRSCVLSDVRLIRCASYQMCVLSVVRVIKCIMHNCVEIHPSSIINHPSSTINHQSNRGSKNRAIMERSFGRRI